MILLNKAAGNRKVYESLARELAKIGIASLRVDLRGHGESVNKGKFDPHVPVQQRISLEGEENDVCASFRYLKVVAGVDARRIGFVGASYSGEVMMVCARKDGYGKAYVALSPGSFSKESMEAIDPSGIPWLFIRSTQEKSKVMKESFSALREKSNTAQFMEVGGTRSTPRTS